LEPRGWPMFKNKHVHNHFVRCSLPILVGAMVSVANGQTVGDFLGQGGNVPNAPPPAMTEQYRSSINQETQKSQTKTGIFLVGIFSSKDTAHAEFDVDGKSQYYGVGDRFKDGWIIEKINSNSVEFRRCSGAKSCARKTMYFSGI
jgi:hypothetical protein